MQNLTLTPAYGRDYRSKAAVLQDLAAGKDFIEALSGKPINLEDLETYGVPGVSVRYQKLTKQTILQVSDIRTMATKASTTKKRKPAKKKITVARVMRAVRADNGTGFCRSCGVQANGFVEPDARAYPCDSCGKKAVYGAEELLFYMVG